MAPQLKRKCSADQTSEIKKKGGMLQERRAMLMAQHMLFADRIVELVHIDGISFIHSYIIQCFSQQSSV
jgi:hypothetical protein